jgi:hypothetical protein
MDILYRCSLVKIVFVVEGQGFVSAELFVCFSFFFKTWLIPRHWHNAIILNTKLEFGLEIEYITWNLGQLQCNIVINECRCHTFHYKFEVCKNQDLQLSIQSSKEILTTMAHKTHFRRYVSIANMSILKKHIIW